MLFDLTSKLTLRGGYRYVWGDSSKLRAACVRPYRAGIGKPEAKYRQGRILVPAIEPVQHFTGDYEGAGTDKAYFRTSLYSYQRGRLRGSYQISPTLSLAAEFSALSNQNPTPNINYDYFAMQTSASVLWSPKAEGPLSMQASYTRSTIRSDIQYLAPQNLQPERSFYRDNAHSIHALVDLSSTGISRAEDPKSSAGGMFFLSSGSRPTNYFPAFRPSDDTVRQGVGLGLRMDLLWLRRSFLHLRRFPRKPDHHGNSDDQIGGPVRTIAFLLPLTLAVGAVLPSADSQRGEDVFQKQGCVTLP